MTAAFLGGSRCRRELTLDGVDHFPNTPQFVVERIVVQLVPIAILERANRGFEPV